MTIDVDPVRVLKELEQHAKKRFGQHFLAKPSLVRRMVVAAGVQPGDKVLEIGPGLGILTQALVEAGAQVTCVEVDEILGPRIARLFPEVRVVQADATKVDWDDVCPGEGWACVANLPYNVGTGLVMDLARQPQRFRRLTCMLQAEVVNRLCAEPGTKAYGALTVQLALWGDARPVLAVPPSAFVPPPKVDSLVVRVDLHEAPRTDGQPPAAVERTIKAAFSQRRKTLRNALKATYGAERVAAALDAIDLDGGVRAERLEASAFVALSAALSEP